MGHAGPDGLETYMAWNEPGGNKPKDPWGGGGDQGPPDLDEALKNLKDKINSVFGGSTPCRSPIGPGPGPTGLLMARIVRAL